MTTCNAHNCELNTYKDADECILHCKKSSYGEDFNKGGLLLSFYESLINDIVNFAFSYKKETSTINKETLKEYLKDNDQEINEEFNDFLIESTFVFTKIFFPGRDSRDRFDYTKVLKKLSAIHFNYCEFASSWLDLNSVKLFYQDCIFHEYWYIDNSEILENVDNIIYQFCTFKKDVVISSGDDERRKIKNSLFNNCNFEEKLELSSTDFLSPLFRNKDNIPTKIRNFNIYDCVFDDKFILNNCDIENYISDSTIFNSKFEFKNNKIHKLNITNTNFFKLVDTYKTSFIHFSIHKSIFEGFVGFENCEFGSNENVLDKNTALFMYATFLGFVNFRNTLFHNGLDLEHINLKESPNFLNAQIDPKNTNRETFRIIKNSFDKIGNHIEANKYFTYEMKKHKEELEKTDNTQEKIIFFLNEKISNFGQNYIQPIIWIIITTIIYELLVAGYDNNILYKLYPPANEIIKAVSNFLNDAASNILPLSKSLKKGMEFISLLFYIAYASLIWQTIIAVKRHTKR